MITLVDISNALIHRLNLAFLKVRLFVQYRFGLLKQYQPLPFPSKILPVKYSGRECHDRFEAISKVLPSNIPLSMLDVGCNIGYFVFRIAKWGGMCLGTDIGRNEIMTANAIATINNIKNAAFFRFEVTPETVHSLPRFDLVICLSVFHHFVRHFGEKNAVQIMSIIANKTRYLVFETGQPDEVEKEWAKDLQFMGADPQEWSSNFLKDIGFTTVHYLGEFPTSVSIVPRHLFVAEKE